MQHPLRVLALGDVEHAELRSVVQRVADSRWSSLTEGDEAPQGAFDLVLLLQERPGRIDAARAAVLRQAHPLAGLVVVLGTWCEGEMRTGQPLPHCERVFWYQFPAWWQSVTRAWTAGRPAAWQHPAGVSPDGPRLDGQLIAIDTPDADAAESLIDVCHALGGSAVWTPRWRCRPMGTRIAAGIWVGGQLDAVEELDLANFRGWLPVESPLVALLDFPRRDRIRRAEQLGVTAVLGKPWRIDQLASCLQLQTSASAT